MSKAIPHAWRFCEFGDIAKKIEGGGTPARNNPEFWSGKIPWVTVKDLKKVRLSFAEESISELGLRESSSRLIPKNTLIIATRMALGKAVVFDKDVTINQDLKAVFPTQDVESEYLLQWYLSKSEYIQSMGTGSTVKGIRLDDLRLIPIKLPPLPEQQKIAAILTSVDDVIEFTQAQINKLKDLKAGIMQELLTKGVGHTEFKDSPAGRIPKAWEIFKIKDICLSIVDCVNKTAPVVDYPTPYKMIRTTNVRKGRVDTENVRYATQETFEQWTRRTPPQSGDLIFTREAPVGEVGILKKSDGVFLGQRTMLYRANEEKTNNVFLLYSMQSEYCQKQIQDFSGGSTVAHMRVPDCGEILIKVPPIAEQKFISDVLTSIEQSIEIKELKEAKLIAKKKALMQDLLTGKVRVKVN